MSVDPTLTHVHGLLARLAPPTSHDTFSVLDPSTGEPIAEVARVGAAEVDAAVDAAADALPAWSATAPRRRSEILHAAHALMLAELEPLALLMSLEMGKTRADARAEVRYAAEFFRWFAEEAVRIGGELRTAPGGANRIATVHRPVGVALLLTPWNFPAAMATRKLAPALAAGCTALLKPAEDTPLTAVYLGDLLSRAGVPDGVVHVLTTDRPAELVEWALADARVRKVSFTGSTPVGRSLLRQTADRVVNTSLELGGNAPFLVLEDADLDDAVEGAMYAKMRNGGQACTSANRFLVHSAVVDDFAERLTGRMAALRVGPGTDEATELGPMVNAKRQRDLAARVDGAVGAGAKVHTGGEPLERPGFFYPATVLSGVGRESVLSVEETFGPIAPIIEVESDDDAVALATDTEFGLAAYVYSRDLGRALSVGERLQAGMVGVNRGAISDPAAPFGGMKQSGLGREGGFEGIHEYLEVSYLAVAW
ncbi:NAD-dependent succinate-semialdehyde dehydrogenase [Actinomycetospora termitidis]|uniref:NAD-dependent succinate-semialdehyde dehydrogenase n=1 Tax=Actinomycetospora termitidis TaxID=3053470 RepID=A0ABT7MGI0_9PSEU|nr:NAD-dependent succinate-semialdehyde dehydrogenase [Actinomycetospora sp. Odt1-22]MDL5159786.1 NAD-dependent succinate-semialdehyde dehydrogenase [Actinomycetospora sp. Odt1-22]